MPEVYVLLSLKDRRTCTGSTKEIGARIKEHNQGQVKATRFRRPLQLIHIEHFEILKEARKREAFLKTGRGRKELNLILKTKNTLNN